MDDVYLRIIAVADEPEIMRLKKLMSLCSNIISCQLAEKLLIIVINGVSGKDSISSVQ